MEILYISSSVGLGHVTRDYRLALELKKRGHRLTWVSSGIALDYLRSKRESIHPVCSELKSLGDQFEKFFVAGRLAPSVKNLAGLYRAYSHNRRKMGEIKAEYYDAVISDEGWEFLGNPNARTFFITDFEDFSGRFGTVGSYLVRRLNGWYHGILARNAVNYYVGLIPPTSNVFRYFGQIFTHEGKYPASGDKNYAVITLGGTRAAAHIAEKIRKLQLSIPTIFQSPGSSGNRFDPLPAIANASVVICMAGYGTLLEISVMKKRAIINVPFNDFEQESNAEIFRGRKGYRVVYMDRETDYKKAIEEVAGEEPDPPPFRDSAADLADDIETNLKGA
ncbi:MAG: glycosyltransferase [Nitrososphaeria archaeon]